MAVSRPPKHYTFHLTASEIASLSFMIMGLGVFLLDHAVPWLTGESNKIAKERRCRELPKAMEMKFYTSDAVFLVQCLDVTDQQSCELTSSQVTEPAKPR